jgi:hypothetical protein
MASSELAAPWIAAELGVARTTDVSFEITTGSLHHSSCAVSCRWLLCNRKMKPLPRHPQMIAPVPLRLGQPPGLHGGQVALQGLVADLELLLQVLAADGLAGGEAGSDGDLAFVPAEAGGQAGRGRRRWRLGGRLRGLPKNPGQALFNLPIVVSMLSQDRPYSILPDLICRILTAMSLSRCLSSSCVWIQLMADDGQERAIGGLDIEKRKSACPFARVTRPCHTPGW